MNILNYICEKVEVEGCGVLKLDDDGLCLFSVFMC